MLEVGGLNSTTQVSLLISRKGICLYFTFVDKMTKKVR